MRKILETKLNVGNVIKGINTWAIPALRYSAAFLNWTKAELQEMDRRTRKLLTMHNGLHPRSNVDRLYIPRREGGRGLMSVEDIVNLATIGLKRYVKESKEKLLVAARGDTENEELETENEFKRKSRQERKANWKEKVMHGQFLRQTEDVTNRGQWLWQQEGSLKRETETLIRAAQEQAVRTNFEKAKIDKTQEDSTCRMCGKADESINHLLSECSKMAQKEYKRRHDWIGRKIHWEVCRKYGLDTKDRWYEHEPQSVCENEEYKILWDFLIQTDHVIEARRPDMIIVEKKNNNRPDLVTLPECVVSEIQIDRKKYFFAVIYRSPSQDQSEFDNLTINFELLLSKMQAEKIHSVLLSPAISTVAQLNRGKMILKIMREGYLSRLLLNLAFIN